MAKSNPLAWRIAINADDSPPSTRELNFRELSISVDSSKETLLGELKMAMNHYFESLDFERLLHVLIIITKSGKVKQSYVAGSWVSGDWSDKDEKMVIRFRDNRIKISVKRSDAIARSKFFVEVTNQYPINIKNPTRSDQIAMDIITIEESYYEEFYKDNPTTVE